MRTGVKKDGTITSHQIVQYANCGAYGGYKPGGAMGGSNQAAGPYKIENVKIESTNCYTNTLPGQIYRAPGEFQAVFALESQLDEAARAIGMDPVEFRLKNLVGPGEEWAAGEHMDHLKVKETLQGAIDAAGYNTPKAPNVGRGVAIGDRSAGGGQAHLGITLNPDGSIILGTPVFDQGTGTYTILSQVVAEELDLPVEDMAFEVWDTDSVDFDGGVAGSRQARVASSVAYEASQEAKKEIVTFVARSQGWPEASLSFRGPEIWRTDIEEKVNWRDLLRQAGETIKVEAHVNETSRAHITSFCAQVAEVSVDPETGEVDILKFTSSHDIGQILNELGHQGQINGAVMQGIGMSLMEELRVEEGRVTNPSLGDYKIPTIRDIPAMQTVLLRDDVGFGPYNVKGIGELPIVPVSAAIMNAIRDAAGVRITDLPATAEKVYRALKAKNGA
jgi:CO/xanthine dehydrogenase Mo-binding subunit